MSSGNLLADRRMEFARDLHARGAAADALDVLEQALALAPDWLDAHFLRGEWLAGAMRRDDAVAHYRRCLELDPTDRSGAILRLALLGAVAAPPAPPPAYVAGLFDDYAARFERALLEKLDYSVPADLHALVTRLYGANARYARVLDLGCGTGLAGERFRTACAWLEGVDLSDGMVAQARRKTLYDELAVADAIGFLGTATGRYDLIVAADVLVYIGDLGLLFAAAANALSPGGRFAFSVEAAAGDGFRLTAGQRYAHSETYLRDTLSGTGLAFDALTETVCRLEANKPVHGILAVARKPGGAASAQPAIVANLTADAGRRLDG